MSMNGETTASALNSNWLDSDKNTSAAQSIGRVAALNTSAPNYSTYQVYITSPARPIKLTLGEIDKLRKVAKKDTALKDILAKFTPQIEIVVDFE